MHVSFFVLSENTLHVYIKTPSSIIWRVTKAHYFCLSIGRIGEMAVTEFMHSYLYNYFMYVSVTFIGGNCLIIFLSIYPLFLGHN